MNSHRGENKVFFRAFWFFLLPFIRVIVYCPESASILLRIRDSVGTVRHLQSLVLQTRSLVRTVTHLPDHLMSQPLVFGYDQESDDAKYRNPGKYDAPLFKKRESDVEYGTIR